MSLRASWHLCGASALSEVSTRLWFEEGLWNALSRRAIAEHITIRELAPRLVNEALRGATRPAAAPHPQPVQAPLPPAPVASDAAAGPPVVPMAETYICGVCGAEIKLGAVSQHINRHLKEQQAAQAARS